MRNQVQEAMARAAASLSRGMTCPGDQTADRPAGHVAGRTVAVVAGAHGEGATTITAGLAGQLAELFGLKVLVVAMDGNPAGLQRALTRAGVSAQGIEMDAAGAPSAPAGVGVMVAPATNGELVRLLQRARAAWDIVLVDTPPPHASIRAMLAARACGEAVLVIRAGSLSWDALREVRDELERDEVQVVGTVMNAHVPPLPPWLERLTR